LSFLSVVTVEVMPGGSQDEVARLRDQPEALSVEEDLFTLNAMAPDVLDQVPSLFAETVRESLSYMLGAKESGGVLAWFRGDELASRAGVFDRLVSVYGQRASPIQKMIDRVFGMRVHELLGRLARPRAP
jgi:hypothetical protein